MNILKNLNFDPQSSPLARRSSLIDAMKNLEEAKINCFTCSGTCCTYVANSMQITPLEALEILDSLNLDSSDNSAEISLIAKLSQTVTDYRLDQELMTGKKGVQNFRRTYTCPFFTSGSKGRGLCGLSRSSKPYGCLAFNPRIEEDNGGQCSSDVQLSENRESEFNSFEEHANNIIRKKYNIHWKKLDIPRALLFFLKQSALKKEMSN